MWDWLSQISPNTALPVAVAVRGYVYHTFVSVPSRQTITHQLDGVRGKLQEVVAAILPGTSLTTVAAQLRQAAEAEVAALGLSKSPLVQAAVDAAINAAV